MNVPLASTPRPRTGRSSQTRVLVVDDDRVTRLILEELLSSNGYAVELAADAASGLAAFAEGPFDVVLLDVRLPGTDGIEACVGFRALPGGDRAALMLMSADRDKALRARAVHSGADDFLIRPLDNTETLLRVRSLVRIKRLRDDLDERSALVRAQNSALLRMQEERRHLNAMIVHDLKGPLSVLLSNVRFALDEAGLSTDAREGLEEVVESATAMHRMVLDLLDTDRAEEGQLNPQPSWSSAAEVLNAAERSAVGPSRTQSHRFSVRCDEPSLSVHADQDLVRRVLQNLLDNAFKYAPANSEIELGARRGRDGGVELWVSDCGPGIPAPAKEAVFDRYVRLDRDLKTSEHSSRGLGLAFCRVAVDAMGGTIQVEDNRPTGARFLVRLPPGRADA
jgi:two-component system, sensor histidine kinase and response regulator